MHVETTFEKALEWGNFWIKHGWASKVYIFQVQRGIWAMTHDVKFWMMRPSLIYRRYGGGVTEPTA